MNVVFPTKLKIISILIDFIGTNHCQIVTMLIVYIFLSIALLDGVVYGFFPAWQAAQVSPVKVLKDE